MSLFLNKIEAVVARINSEPQVKLVNYTVEPLTSQDEISVLKQVVPELLLSKISDLLFNDLLACKLVWEASEQVFGDGCTRGYVQLLSPKEMLAQLDDQKFEAEEAEINQHGNEVGYQAIIEDWPHWIPLFRFRSGDVFCIETRESGFPVVLLEHDVADAGPNLHGLQIAKNIETLINDWSSLLFIEVNDWSEICNEDGLNLNSSILRKIRHEKGQN